MLGLNLKNGLGVHPLLNTVLRTTWVHVKISTGVQVPGYYCTHVYVQAPVNSTSTEEYSSIQLHVQNLPDPIYTTGCTHLYQVLSSSDE